MKPPAPHAPALSTPLNRRDLHPDPFVQFRDWHAAHAGPEPDAAALATSSPTGVPTVRMVLLRGVPDSRLRFFTNLESRKAQQLAGNPRVALTWYDAGNGRQVRVEGTVERLPPDDADAYWETRARASRASALVSRQSTPVSSRQAMEESREAILGEFEGKEIPRPLHWGGYRVLPQRFEFWQHREDRFHDRFAFERDSEGGWSITRLWP